MSCEQLGVRQSPTGERCLHNEFLLPHQTLRRNQRLPTRCHRGVCPGNFDRSLGTLVDLIFVVFQKPLCQTESLLFYLDVFIQADEVGVKARHTRYSVDHLLTKNEVGDSLTIPCNADVPLVHAGAKALQKRLCDCETETGIDKRIVGIASGVRGVPAVVEADAQLSTQREPDVHTGVCIYHVLSQPIRTSENRTVFGRGYVLAVHLAGEDRIVLRDRRAVRQGGGPGYRQVVLLLADQRDVGEVCVHERRWSRSGCEVRQQRTVGAADPWGRFIYQQTQPAEQSASPSP